MDVDEDTQPLPPLTNSQAHRLLAGRIHASPGSVATRTESTISGESGSISAMMPSEFGSNRSPGGYGGYSEGRTSPSVSSSPPLVDRPAPAPPSESDVEPDAASSNSTDEYEIGDGDSGEDSEYQPDNASQMTQASELAVKPARKRPNTTRKAAATAAKKVGKTPAQTRNDKAKRIQAATKLQTSKAPHKRIANKLTDPESATSKGNPPVTQRPTKRRVAKEFVDVYGITDQAESLTTGDIRKGAVPPPVAVQGKAVKVDLDDAYDINHMEDTVPNRSLQKVQVKRKPRGAPKAQSVITRSESDETRATTAANKLQQQQHDDFDRFDIQDSDVDVAHALPLERATKKGLVRNMLVDDQEYAPVVRDSQSKIQPAEAGGRTLRTRDPNSKEKGKATASTINTLKTDATTKQSLPKAVTEVELEFKRRKHHAGAENSRFSEAHQTPRTREKEFPETNTHEPDEDSSSHILEPEAQDDAEAECGVSGPHDIYDSSHVSRDRVNDDNVNKGKLPSRRRDELRSVAQHNNSNGKIDQSHEIDLLGRSESFRKRKAALKERSEASKKPKTTALIHRSSQREAIQDHEVEDRAKTQFAVNESQPEAQVQQKRQDDTDTFLLHDDPTRSQHGILTAESAASDLNVTDATLLHRLFQLPPNDHTSAPQPRLQHDHGNLEYVQQRPGHEGSDFNEKLTVTIKNISNRQNLTRSRSSQENLSISDTKNRTNEGPALPQRGSRHGILYPHKGPGKNDTLARLSTTRGHQDTFNQTLMAQATSSRFLGQGRKQNAHESEPHHRAPTPPSQVDARTQEFVFRLTQHNSQKDDSVLLAVTSPCDGVAGPDTLQEEEVSVHAMRQQAAVDMTSSEYIKALQNVTNVFIDHLHRKEGLLQTVVDEYEHGSHRMLTNALRGQAEDLERTKEKYNQSSIAFSETYAAGSEQARFIQQQCQIRGASTDEMKTSKRDELHAVRAAFQTFLQEVNVV